MRVPNYLSPTSISLFITDREQFYLNYLADTRMSREPQTQPMSVGSAFDAFVKSTLHENIFGKGADPAYEVNTLFESQVEAHNRDWAWTHGKFVYDTYVDSGAFADFALELERATSEPQFEFTVESKIPHEAITGDGVPLLGKPDVSYRINDLLIIRDWKVNGYCANRLTSPKKGYVSIRPGGKAHKDAILSNHRHGIIENLNHNLNDIDESWARQLTIYAWVLGEPIGSTFLAAIEQLACSGPMNPIRVALYSSTTCPHYQRDLYNLVGRVWKAITTGHIFDELTAEENDNKVDYLNSLANNPTELALYKMMKPPSYF